MRNPSSFVLFSATLCVYFTVQISSVSGEYKRDLPYIISSFRKIQIRTLKTSQMPLNFFPLNVKEMTNYSFICYLLI